MDRMTFARGFRQINDLSIKLMNACSLPSYESHAVKGSWYKLGRREWCSFVLLFRLHPVRFDKVCDSPSFSDVRHARRMSL